MNASEDRFTLLERRLRRMQVAFVTLLALVTVAAFANHSVAASRTDNTVLHVRGIVIEDERGQARLLLGAPTPAVPNRTRPEPVNGLVLLGPNGADRVVVSYPGLEPQVMGKVARRSIPVASAGFIINDAEGNERAGLGASDDGTRVALGMDYADRDAVGLLVSPNFSGFIAFARNGERNDQATLAVLKDGTSTLKLADNNGDEGVIVEDRKGMPLKVQVQNPVTHKLEDVTSQIAH